MTPTPAHPGEKSSTINVPVALSDCGVTAASGTRWTILTLISVMYLITYMDRTNVSVAASAMAREFSLTKTAVGLIFSAFLWAYALGQIPAGWLADRIGPRKVLLFIVPFWSLMTAMTALATGAASLIGIRFIFGLGEAGAFPAATRAMQLWFPRTERGIAQGVTHSFSRFAIAVTPFVAVSIQLALGWRSVFYIFGAAGLLWSAAFYFLYRNLPEEHKRVNRAELAHIRGCDVHGAPVLPASQRIRSTAPWKMILHSRNMWYIAIGYSCFYYGTYFFITWFPTYLMDYRHLSLQAVGPFASLPLLAGVVGDIVGGWLTDTAYKRTGKLKFSRRIVAAPALLASGLFLIPAAVTIHPWTAVMCLTGSLFFLELVIGPAWAVPMDVGGEYSGTVTGVMNMAGSLAASASPIVFGFLAERGYWIAPFLVTAAVLLSGALVWTFLIDPETSVVESAALASGT